MLLSSGKAGSDKYELRTTDKSKIYPRIDARIWAQALKRFFEFGRGYSLSGAEGSPQAVNDLSVITTSNINDYQDDFAKNIQTFIANACRLDDISTSANTIILKAPKITSSNAPNGENYTVETPLPFEFKDGLRFTFRAKLTNTGAVQIAVNNFSGLPNAVELIREDGTPLIGGETITGRYYTIVCTTVANTKKLVLITTNHPIPATDSIAGSLRISTQSETNLGIDNSTAVSPLKLASFLTGMTFFYPAPNPPQGFLEANGASLSTATYSQLFSVIGYHFGGSGLTFNLPDLRGIFLRGYDNGRGIDIGRVFGSFQADEIRSHSHTYQAASLGQGADGGGDGLPTNAVYHPQTSPIGGVETRPYNIALLPIIKY